MPTVIGVIFFLYGAYCFLCEEESLFGLLLISSVFEAASAVNIGERGIQPYYLVALFIIARALLNRLLGRRSIPMPEGKWLFFFGLIGAASAIFSPIIFAGIPIYDPKIGIDDGLFIRPPLAIGVNNFIQGGYLVLHIVTAFSLLSLKFSFTKARRAYLFAFYIEVFFLCAESFCQLVGISFPLSLVLNNPGYALWKNSFEAYGTRNPGTFSEPSLAGPFLVLYCIGFFAQYMSRKSGSLKTIVAFFASGLVASTTSLFVLCLFPFVLIFRYPPFRFPWYINVGQLRRIVWISFVLLVPLVLALVAFSGYREVLTAVTVSKGDSGSFINRTASDLYALQLVFKTYGIGVGIGSSRTSSYIGTLLSNVGIAGTLAFGIFGFRLFSNLPEDYQWFKWAAFAFFTNIAIGVADITMPMLWVPVFLAIQVSANNKVNSQTARSAVLVPAPAPV